jgi:uncharacterized membrane protein
VSRAALLIAAAVLVRLVPILASDRVSGDVLRYQKVAGHVLDVSWNPYQTRNLYPYPPVWVWFEAGSEWLARRDVLSFPVLVKLPVLAAELLLVVVLLRWGRERGAGDAPAWTYALHPVAVLVAGFHGQFDSLALLAVMLSLRWMDQGRADRSALALAAGIATKSFPVLLVPLFCLVPGLAGRARLRFAALALGPVALLLLPYAIDDLPALRRELVGYGGVADFGWIGLYRGGEWLATGELARSEASFWATAVPVGKTVFLLTYAAMVLALAKGRLRAPRVEAALSVLLAFLVLYGAVSAQYLLWVVPLAALAPDRRFVAYSAAATVALLGFYAFLSPGVLHGGDPWVVVSKRQAGTLWVLGVAAVTATALLWWVALLRRVTR